MNDTNRENTTIRYQCWSCHQLNEISGARLANSTLLFGGRQPDRPVQTRRPPRIYVVRCARCQAENRIDAAGAV
jgi:hypothetical protein